jgi:hypothetical protein
MEPPLMSTAALDLPAPQTPSRSQNPFEAARLTLIRQLLAMKAPKAYSAFPSPADHEGIADHIREAAAIFDAWLAAIGFQIADNATTQIDMRSFEGAFTGAIEGNATYECERAAQALRDDRRAA